MVQCKAFERIDGENYCTYCGKKNGLHTLFCELPTASLSNGKKQKKKERLAREADMELKRKNEKTNICFHTSMNINKKCVWKNTFGLKDALCEQVIEWKLGTATRSTVTTIIFFYHSFNCCWQE